MKMNPKTNTFGARAELDSGSGKVTYYRLDKLTEDGIGNISKLPFSIKILLEAVLRNENGHEVTREDVEKIANYNPLDPALAEFPYMPARVLLQDFTGVPAVVDLAALRSAMARIGGDPERINPQIPVDLVIDHSVQVDAFGSSNALAINSQKEFERNKERYEFLHWGQDALQNFNVVPPASGICHQVNLEYLAQTVWTRDEDGETVAYPDSVVGTDSHTTM
ncbi:MAG: aconitate hydratase, partial [Calditrichaeota bacterium]|nr:aconitate hydratase [Calditrichota bacterium]